MARRATPSKSIADAAGCWRKPRPQQAGWPRGHARKTRPIVRTGRRVDPRRFHPNRCAAALMQPTEINKHPIAVEDKTFLDGGGVVSPNRQRRLCGIEVVKDHVHSSAIVDDGRPDGAAAEVDAVGTCQPDDALGRGIAVDVAGVEGIAVQLLFSVDVDGLVVVDVDRAKDAMSVVGAIRKLNAALVVNDVGSRDDRIAGGEVGCLIVATERQQREQVVFGPGPIINLQTGRVVDEEDEGELPVIAAPRGGMSGRLSRLDTNPKTSELRHRQLIHDEVAAA